MLKNTHLQTLCYRHHMLQYLLLWNLHNKCRFNWANLMFQVAFYSQISLKTFEWSNMRNLNFKGTDPINLLDQGLLLLKFLLLWEPRTRLKYLDLQQWSPKRNSMRLCLSLKCRNWYSQLMYLFDSEQLLDSLLCKSMMNWMHLLPQI